MPWQYEDSTGRLTKDGTYVDTGYSGNGAGLNNPDDVSIPNVGPIVPGRYWIGPPKNPVDHLGPFALPLVAIEGEASVNKSPPPQMVAHLPSIQTIQTIFPSSPPYIPPAPRGGFFIHGDNALMNHTASQGCIIMKRQTRVMIAASDDRELIVVP